jgi:ABC-type antimicrobial peptide transport system permease subunit
LLRAFLFGVGAIDGVALTASVLILAAVSVLACYVPARGAARSNPLDALRE